MPAGTDVVAYAPCKGVTGDDRYDLDVAAEVRWIAGTNAYSSTPTLTEILAGTGLNQIIAYANHRMQLGVDQGYATGGAVSAIPYVTVGTKGLGGFGGTFNNLRLLIDRIRSWEAQTVYTWPADFPTSSTPVGPPKVAHILALRKALALDYQPQAILAAFYAEYNRASVYPPDTAGTFTTTPGIDTKIGQRCASSTYRAQRRILALNLPSYGLTPAAFDLILNLTGASTYGLNLEVWDQATYHNSFASGNWTDLNAQLASVAIAATYGPTDTVFNCTKAMAAGSNYSFMLLSNEERTDNNQGGLAAWTSLAQLNTPLKLVKLYN